MAELRLVSADTDARLRQIDSLYIQAFPKAERKPFSLILKKQKQGIVEILCIEAQDGTFLGEAVTVQNGDLVLLDYFAVCPQTRGNGVGSAALGLLRERYQGKRLFLEIESTKEKNAANAEQRKKRKAFYLRNGLRCMDYTVLEFGVVMEILTFCGDVSFQELRGLYRAAFGRLLAVNIQKANGRFSAFTSLLSRRRK